MSKYFYCLPTLPSSLYDVDKTSYLARSYSNTWTKGFLLLVFVNRAKVLVTMSFRDRIVFGSLFITSTAIQSR